jgi:hypothetical protein
MAIAAGFVVRFLPLAVIAAVVPAQAAGWQPAATPVAPPPREDHALAYDEARQRTVLFGGWSLLASHADTWEWNGATWAAVTPAASPPARSAHAMAYDAARQEVVVFGGMGASAAQLSDTWVWNGTTWTQRAPLSSPSARHNHAMAYDAARQRVVLFGGAFGVGGYLADTWEWNGTNWTQRFPAAQPFVRSNHAMAYDAARQRVVLFGGFAPFFGAVNDTWEWDGVGWTEITAATAGRFDHAMAWSSGLQGVIVFGGRTANLSQPQPQFTDHADTRFWNGSAWTQVATSPTPSARSKHALAWHAATNQVVLFGGTQGASTALWGDTWVFTGTLATATPYGAACGTPPLVLTQVAQSRPLLGQTAVVRLAATPTPAVAFAIGWSSTTLGTIPLPLSLTGVGLTDCFLHQSADVIGLPFVASGTGFDGAVAVPNAPSLLGGHAYVQAFGFAPGQNPAQLTTSNGVDWRFGNL